jgi:hypothetical protein
VEGSSTGLALDERRVVVVWAQATGRMLMGVGKKRRWGRGWDLFRWCACLGKIYFQFS